MRTKSVKVKVLTNINNSGEDFLSVIDGLKDDEGSDENENYLSEFINELSENEDFVSQGKMSEYMELEGTLSEDENRLSLRFSPIIGGVRNTSEEYLFEKSKRNSLTLIKDVIISETLFFSTEKKRQSVVTENEFGSFELNIYTKKLENTVTYDNGGYIELEYITEAKAFRIGYTKEYILVETI